MTRHEAFTGEKKMDIQQGEHVLGQSGPIHRVVTA